MPESSTDMVRRIAPVTKASAVATIHATVRRSDRIAAGDFSGLTVLAAKRDLLGAVSAGVASGRFFSGPTNGSPRRYSVPGRPPAWASAASRRENPLRRSTSTNAGSA